MITDTGNQATTLSDVKILYFKDGDKSSSAEMVASLIDQLVVSTIDQKWLIGILKDGHDSDNSTSCKEFKKLWKIFVNMLHRQILAEGLPTSKEVGARFLITSRPISETFTGDPDVSTIEMDIEKGIRQFVEEKVSATPRLHRFKEHIISTVPENVGGMFRYAALMFEELNHSSAKNVTDILNTMLDGLNGMYELMLLRLHERHPKDAQLRRRI
ncbi:hypothetical protein BDD12DRAFT_801859 [Trichophaea hybrida]|nr:hypothetical protein BDD12DRAFT_801859 [Trichophaea hybrida]